MHGLIETGDRGHREGGDLYGEQRWMGGRWTGIARVSLFDFEDAIRPDRSPRRSATCSAARFAEQRRASHARVGARHEPTRGPALPRLGGPQLDGEPMSGRLLVFVCLAGLVAGFSAPCRGGRPCLGGMHALPDDQACSGRLAAPRDAQAPTAGRARWCIPPQKLTIRFNHKKHVKEAGANCKVCHAKAKTSKAAADNSSPPAPRATLPRHRPLRPARRQGGQGRERAVHVLPPRRTRRARRKGGARRHPHSRTCASPTRRTSTETSNCAQCHGSVNELELATRDQLPRMAGCFGCHNMSGAAQGQAKSACTDCHVTEPDGRMPDELRDR